MCGIFGKDIVNVRTCQRWFSKFRPGDLSLQESDRSGQQSKIDNDVLRSMLENNPHLTSRETAEGFGIHHTTVGDHIKSRVCVKAKCLAPHELTEKNLSDYTTSGCFYPRSNHWEVGGRPQCNCRVRIAHNIVSRLWRQFQTTGTVIRGSVVVVHEEPHPQMTVTLSYRPEETGGRQREKSLDTRHRRLDDRYRVLPWPEDCTVVWREHRNWRDNEWGRVLLTDESRFSLSSDSHRILIWRERGSRNHPSNIIERDRYGGRGVLVWGGIMLGSRTDLHIFDAGSVNGTRYCNEILLPYVRLFRGAMGLQFLFMDDNAPCHRTVAAEQLLESEDIERMDWPA
ncbi:transposable element Tc1 transposase [Trichonephila clavipes]|nr:transposable element Tc1 transposase [Trichonephila clavipes]